MTFDVGTTYTMSLSVTNAAGAAVNPATCSVTITMPDLSTTVVTPTLPPAVTGLVTFPFTAAQAGLHQFAWSTTSPQIQKSDYENFRNFRSIGSLAAAKDRLGQNRPNSDEKIRYLMGAATREVEKVVGILVPTVFTNDFIPGTYRDVLRVPHGPIYMPAGNTQPNGSVTSLRSYYPSGPSWQCGGAGNIIAAQAMPGTIREIGLIPFWYGPWLVTYTAGVQVVEEWAEEAWKEVLFEMWQQMRGLTADMAAQAADSLTVGPWFRMPARALTLLDGHEMPGFG